MGLNYENDTRNVRHAFPQYWAETQLKGAGEFPKCKGLYPDCPDEPNLMNSMCRTCPKTDGMKKPKLED